MRAQQIPVFWVPRANGRSGPHGLVWPGLNNTGWACREEGERTWSPGGARHQHWVLRSPVPHGWGTPSVWVMRLPAEAQLWDAWVKGLLLFRDGISALNAGVYGGVRPMPLAWIGSGGVPLTTPHPKSSRWTCCSRLPARPSQALLVCRINYEILCIFLQRHLVLLIRNP